MNKKRIAINGFGRIGRLTLRALLNKNDVEVVAINDLSNAKTLAHLFQYDSSQGKFSGVVQHEDNALIIDNKRIELFSERDPLSIPWGKLNVDVVIESTGIFRSKDKASLHIQAGAKKVIISAPSKKNDVPTIVLGVNEQILDEQPTIISNASCTTNCLAPIAKIIDDNFGIEQGFITTVHSYTSDQRLLDAPHDDLRRARAAAVSMIPTSTGAASATGLVLPNLKGKLDGIAVRVPTPTGSLTDMVFNLSKPATKEEINSIIKSEALNSYKGIIEFSDVELVSADIVGNTHSSIFDSLMTFSMGKTIKLLSWYDNEFGYANRLADLAVKL